MEKIDQVIECHLVSGGYDYLMKFVTAGIGEYQTIMERLTDMDIGIDKYFSFVVLKSPIVKAHMPLPSLFPMLERIPGKGATVCRRIASIGGRTGDELGVADEAVEPGRIELRH